MNQIIASEAKHRQRVIRYAKKNGVTRAADRFHCCRQAIYNWKKRYDGKSWKSLVEKSHRPKSHPRQHTEDEIKLILRYYPYYKNDKLLLWQKIKENGYARSYKVMLRKLNSLIKDTEKAKRKGRKPKEYKRAEFPGQKVQVDVKYVPSYCVSNGQKYYQYTAVDECTRYTFREIYDEHSTYSSVDFLCKLIRYFPFRIIEIQTDNGTEWTNALLTKDPTKKTLFEKGLEENEIKYHRIRIATPRHNGKVERQHRIDENRFYSKMRMYSLEDGREQIRRYNIKSNSYVKICLGYRSPKEVLEEYLSVMI
ncbi:MAG: transposase [Clostridia bacterium]|nr:transposase [Clostridia bacterium]